MGLENGRAKPMNEPPVDWKEIHLASSYTYPAPPREPLSKWTQAGLTLESFKKRDYGNGIAEFDRPMKRRHVQMIAIGGSIGSGFFVGCGSALHKGGPASLLIDFIIVGVMVFNVVQALGELCIMYPISGGPYTYATRFIDPSWGFAVGWNYVVSNTSTFALELTVCAITMQFWDTDTNTGVWIAVFLALVMIVNIFGAIGYAEEEFWASILKLSSVVIFLIIAVVLVCGGGPSSGQYDHYWGARLWHESPGAFKNGFKGFCSVFVTAAFSFSGTELVGFAAAEAKNPALSMPGAIKQVFWRISIFYILGLFLIGLLIKSDDPSLLSTSAYSDAKTSPFVLIAKYAGLNGLDHFMNAIILVSVLSIGVATVFGGSRTLTALAQQGYAPKIFTYIDKSGRPVISVGTIFFFSLIAFVNLDAKGPVVFEWLQAISGLSTFLIWGSICLAHIRFRQAWKHQGHTLDEIPFKAAGGIYGSWLGLILIILALAAQFYTAIVAPPGEHGMGTAEGFFEDYLGLPVVLFFFACGLIWHRQGLLTIAKIDVDTHRAVHNWDEINGRREKIAAFPFWKRIVWMLFV
ncbi:Amino-acid permease inda1 [Exophiala dermatitidis]